MKEVLQFPKSHFNILKAKTGRFGELHYVKFMHFVLNCISLLVVKSSIEFQIALK